MGSPARGARYNSTLNYIERRRKEGQKMVAVIISEDKTIDTYPSKCLI